MFRLRDARRNAAISQKDLAAKIGVSRSTVAMWENEMSQPDHDSLRKISSALNVSIDYLLGNENNKSEDVTFDDFTYAMHNEAEALSDADKEMLLTMARMMKEKLMKENQE